MVGRRVLQGALLAVLLVGGVLLGLLGMHALDTHGTPGAHAVAGHAAPAHPPASAAHEAGGADEAVVPDDPAHDGGAACVLALLGGLLLLLRPSRALLTGPLLRALRSPVDAAGRVFDPATMEGIATVRAEHPEEDDVVSEVFQKGYRFKGQLLRPARVRVKQYEA